MNTKKLLRYSFWLGPILLGISFIGWEKPIELPLQMPLTFRIIGIFAGLWMAFTLLIVSKGRYIWVQICIGLFSISTAGFIAVGYEPLRYGILRFTGSIEIFYVLVVLLWNITSKTESKIRALKRRIKKELRKIFPAIFLAIGTLSKHLLCLSISSLLISLTWILILVTPENVLEIAKKCGWIFLISGLGVFITIPIMVFVDGTITQFKKTKSPSRGTLIESWIMPALAGLLLVLIFSQGKGFVASALYMLILLAFCFWFYWFLKKTRAKAEKSNYHECIQKILAAEDEEVVRALDPRAFHSTVSITDQGLQFENMRESRLYRWSDIKHLTFDEEKWWRIVVRDEEGNKSRGSIKTKESGLKKRTDVIKKLWHEWEKYLDLDKINKFEYPQWQTEKDKQKNLSYGLLFTGLSIFFLITWFFYVGITANKSDFSEWFVFVFLLTIILCLAGYGVFLIMQSHKRSLRTLSVSGNTLIIDYDDNSTEIKLLSQIKRHALGLDSNQSGLEFNDKTRLVNLDKLSDWPLLRNYLLQELNIENPAKLF